MKQYKTRVLDQAQESLELIVIHKVEYDQNSARDFAIGFYEELEKLSYFPYRCVSLVQDCRAKIYSKHLIVYRIIEPDLVEIIDIVDPKQHTVASKYY